MPTSSVLILSWVSLVTLGAACSNSATSRLWGITPTAFMLPLFIAGFSSLVPDNETKSALSGGGAVRPLYPGRKERKQEISRPPVWFGSCVIARAGDYSLIRRRQQNDHGCVGPRDPFEVI